MDRIGPVFALDFEHAPTHRPRADPAGAAAVGRHPDGGRTRRPARRRRAHRAAVCGPPDRPRRARGVGARPLRRVPARPGVPHASAHAQRRRGAGRAARPGRRPPSRADDDGGARRARRQRPRSGGCCPSASPAGSTPCWTPSPSRLRPASSASTRTAGGPAHHRRRGAPPPAGLDPVHRRDGRRSERTLHPYGIVAHSGRWYVTGADPGIGEDRTFRLDRIADARTLPGSFEPPAGLDPARARAVRVRHGPVPA